MARKQTPKGEQTRARILDAALELVREQGYEATTMRAIAARAGVSPGNAYYYFPSKDQLIQNFYARSHEEHVVACHPILAAQRGLKDRLLGVMRAKLDTIAPYHPFAGVLFKTAADPHSALNPFSESSGPVREEAIALFAEVIEGANVELPPAVRRELPELLWLYHMGVILFWVHDDSAQCERSRKLVERSVELIVTLVSLAQLSMTAPMVEQFLAVLPELRSI